MYIMIWHDNFIIIIIFLDQDKKIFSLRACGGVLRDPVECPREYKVKKKRGAF